MWVILFLLFMMPIVWGLDGLYILLGVLFFPITIPGGIIYFIYKEKADQKAQAIADKNTVCPCLACKEKRSLTLGIPS